MINSLLIITAYLIGSLSGAIMVSALLGHPDPRTEGSKNPGATNVLRQSGKKAALLTLGVDVLKGVIAVLWVKFMTTSTVILAISALAAFLGHLYPLFFQFKGGKGVATAFGVLLALLWPVALCALATWLIVAWLFHYSSLAAIVAALLTPVYTYSVTTQSDYLLLTIIMCGLLIWRHRSNIRHLLTGQEGKMNDP